MLVKPRRAIGLPGVRPGLSRAAAAPWRWLLVLVASLAVPSIPATGQDVVEIPRQPGCRGCSIEFQRIATLGQADGPGIIEGDNTSAVADGRGRYFLYYAYRPWVKVYDAQGRFIKSLGREGEGPGEFRGVGIVRVSAGDTIHVFDGDNPTHSVFSPSLEFVRSNRLQIVPQVTGVALGGNRAVLAVPIHTPERVGLPLHLVDRGRLVRSFGSESGAYRPDIPYFDDRAIAPASGGNLWVAHRNRYQIELWSTDGRKLREYRRSVEWFPPLLRNWSISPNTPPPTRLQQVWEDPEGRLWVKMGVADRNWRRAVRRGGPHGYTIDNDDDYLDTVIEVIEPRRGRVLASRRFPMTVQFIGQGLMGTVVTDEDDVPYYAVWGMRLLSPPSPRSK
jgi:hypothetical protein